jgi:hypothetical protein
MISEFTGVFISDLTSVQSVDEVLEFFTWCWELNGHGPTRPFSVKGQCLAAEGPEGEPI